MKGWALAARLAYGMQTALVGLIAAAHFKSIRTWGVIHAAFQEGIDWILLRQLLARCGDLWGKNGSLALYGSGNMSGSGLPAAGETYLDRFAHWFMQVLEHAAFQKACALLEAGIKSFEAAEKLERSLQDLRQAFKGLLGPYRYKVLYDYLVATDFLPPRWVYTYPVCSDGGTAQGLRELYAISGRRAGSRTYERMLQEFAFQVQQESSTWNRTDHLGTVGAALCWRHRRNTASTSHEHRDRCEQTSTALCERELVQLNEHGFRIFGFQTAASISGACAAPLGSRGTSHSNSSKEEAHQRA